MADLSRAQLLRGGRHNFDGIDLAVRKHLYKERVGDPFDVLHRIEADVGEHRREQPVRARPQGAYANFLALQLADAADLILREHLNAADHDATDHRDRRAVIDLDEKLLDIAQG